MLYSLTFDTYLGGFKVAHTTFTTQSIAITKPMEASDGKYRYRERIKDPKSWPQSTKMSLLISQSVYNLQLRAMSVLSMHGIASYSILDIVYLMAFNLEHFLIYSLPYAICMSSTYNKTNKSREKRENHSKRIVLWCRYQCDTLVLCQEYLTRSLSPSSSLSRM